MFYYFQDKHKLLEGNLEFKEHKYMFNSYEMELSSAVGHPEVVCTVSLDLSFIKMKMLLCLKYSKN
jgi:hypothetical protein